MSDSKAQSLFSTTELSAEYPRERLIFDVTEAIAEVMERTQTTRTELAQRLGKTKGHISQMLSGQQNLTLRTIADLVNAMQHEFRVEAVPLMGEFTRSWELPGEQRVEARFPRLPEQPERSLDDASGSGLAA